jgi:hypothetical protein
LLWKGAHLRGTRAVGKVADRNERP